VSKRIVTFFLLLSLLGFPVLLLIIPLVIAIPGTTSLMVILVGLRLLLIVVLLHCSIPIAIAYTICDDLLQKNNLYHTCTTPGYGGKHALMQVLAF
jgi:hypothetical protein